MLPVPSKFTLVVGCGEGGAPLNAFDSALLDAGIGNLNLIRVSSILPPGARFFSQLEISPGTLTPTAYGYITSSQPGEVIAAAIGVGMSSDTYGVIMEYEGLCTKEEAESRVGAMVKEGFQMRNLALKDLLVLGIDHCVEQCGCVLAAAVLGY